VEQVALNRHEQYFKDNVRELSHTEEGGVKLLSTDYTDSL